MHIGKVWKFQKVTSLSKAMVSNLSPIPLHCKNGFHGAKKPLGYGS